jgi:O-antigen/teichoic acid export membrane protein
MTEAAIRVPGSETPTAAPSTTASTTRLGGGLYFISALVAQACALSRYVVLARLLGPEQLGVAATLVVTSAFFDMISDMGADRFLIQDRDGGTTQVQALVQLASVGRGAMVALLLLIFAVPISYFYKSPQLAGGLAILALSPLINGFIHFDNRRLQRDHDFRPDAISIIAGEICGLSATMVAAFLTHNFTAILYGVIVRAAVIVVTSHLQARRPYRLGWDKAFAPRLARFSAPLMLNGLVMFVSSQGDRVIVGNQLGVKALGYYSAVMLLIYYPAGLMARYLLAINIPLIATHRDQPIERARAIDATGGQTLLLTVAMAVGFAIVAPTMVPILFGRRFAQTAMLIGLIGCLQATRFLLTWPTIVALAEARSATVLMSNLAHGFAFAGAMIGLWIFGGLVALVCGFIVGEVIAVAVALALVNRNLERPLFESFDRLFACVATYSLIIASNLILTAHLWWAALLIAPCWVALAMWLARRERTAINDYIAMGQRIVTSVLRRRPRSKLGA